MGTIIKKYYFLLSILLLVVAIVVFENNVHGSGDQVNTIERRLKTKQDHIWPFSYRMSCGKEGCRTKEGNFHSYEELVELIPTKFDSITRQNYFCWNGLCMDTLLSPAGVDMEYHPESDGLKKYDIFIVGRYKGWPVINIRHCTQFTCYINGDHTKPIQTPILMDQIPTIYKGTHLFECTTGICMDPDGWVIGVTPEARALVTD